MNHIQINAMIIEFNEANFTVKPLLDRNGMLYETTLIRKSDGSTVCKIYGPVIHWNQYPQGNNINQSKGLTTFTVV